MDPYGGRCERALLAGVNASPYGGRCAAAAGYSVACKTGRKRV